MSRVVPTKGWIIGSYIMINKGVSAPAPGAQSWGGPHRRPKIAPFISTGKAKSQFWGPWRGQENPAAGRIKLLMIKKKEGTP